MSRDTYCSQILAKNIVLCFWQVHIRVQLSFARLRLNSEYTATIAVHPGTVLDTKCVSTSRKGYHLIVSRACTSTISILQTNFVI